MAGHREAIASRLEAIVWSAAAVGADTAAGVARASIQGATPVARASGGGGGGKDFCQGAATSEALAVLRELSPRKRLSEVTEASEHCASFFEFASEHCAELCSLFYACTRLETTHNLYPARCTAGS